jgi:hypothetical protein
MRNTIALALLLLATSAFAADGEMHKLDWLVGIWKGEATVKMGPGEPHKVQQTETVQWKAGELVLVVDGRGVDESGKVGHDAYGLMFYDAATKAYRFIAAAAGRGVTDSPMEVGDHTAVWHQTPPGGQIRYTLRLTEKGEWNEIGEFSRDGAACRSSSR